MITCLVNVSEFNRSSLSSHKFSIGFKSGNCAGKKIISKIHIFRIINKQEIRRKNPYCCKNCKSKHSPRYDHALLFLFNYELTFCVKLPKILCCTQKKCLFKLQPPSPCYLVSRVCRRNLIKDTYFTKIRFIQAKKYTSNILKITKTC